MTRRGAGDGNIYKRADGRWESRIQVGYRGGRRVRRSFYGRTRNEVQAQLLKAQHEMEQGTLPPDNRLTLGRYLGRWLADVVTPSVRPSTYRSYEMHVRLYLIPALGSKPLARLAPADVQALLNRKLADGLSPRSVSHLRAVLRRALNQAMRWGLVTRNAAALVDAPRVRHEPAAAMSPSEARSFLGVVAGDRLEALYVLALGTGLRQGEALGLSWTDVDLAGETLTVRRSMQRVDGKLVTVEPKSRTSRRQIMIPAVVLAALRSHRARQIEERLRAGAEWQESGLVFTSSLGAALDGPTVTHHLQRLLANAGHPRLRFHDLRHACASLLMAQGVHPRVVMEILGHSQISLTLNTYSHVIPALKTDAAEQINRALEDKVG